MSGPYATYGRPMTSQNVAYTVTAGTITNAISAHIFLVRVVTTTAAHIAIGVSPTATTSDMYMPAGISEYFRINPGEKVSAIQSAAAGTLHVTEITH